MELGNLVNQLGECERAIELLQTTIRGLTEQCVCVFALALQQHETTFRLVARAHPNVAHADVPCRLGEEHSFTLSAEENCAIALSARGDSASRDRAEAMLRKVLRCRETNLGIRHPRTVSARGNLQRLLAYGQPHEGVPPAVELAPEPEPEPQ